MLAKENKTRLREWRLKRGYTQRQLAAKTQTSTRDILLLEAGLKKGTPNTWLRLARVLRVPVSTLFHSSLFNLKEK